MEEIHGGDIYGNRVTLDFSVNVNPLGVPEAVKKALHHAADVCMQYPDIAARKLKKAVSQMLQVSEEYLLFGNGASELFLAIVHGMKPKKTVIVVPSFYGYEYAAGAAEGEVIFYETKEEDGFSLKEDFFRILTEEAELLFLANPNNPTGKLLDMDYLKRLLWHCKRQGIIVVLDECFIEFCDGGSSVLRDLEQFENLLLVRAFTKSFAIPGVRLGYLVSRNQLLLDRIRGHLPEWNLSCFAQAAGVACAAQREFLEETAAYTRKERQFLEAGLKKHGIRVFPGAANFLLVYSPMPLYESLLERGILIRRCENFRGLSKGFYRIAVKTRKENETLLKVIGEMNWGESIRADR